MANVLPFSYQEFVARRAKQASVPISQDAHRWYQELLASQTVYYDSDRDTWLVLGYDDVQKVLLDVQTFSSRRGILEDGSLDFSLSGGLLGIDPPQHRRLRAQVARVFTPRAIERLVPRITEIVDSLLDRVMPAGHMDLIDDFAFLLPVTVLAEMLNIPVADRDVFRQWSTDFVSADFALRKSVTRQMTIYCKKLVDQRRLEPGDDLISLMLSPDENGTYLSEEEIVSTCLLLLIAGHETTTNLIGSAIICLDEHPDAMQELIADPTLLPGAIEEVARYRAPVHTIVRVVMADTELAGHYIPAGSLVCPMFAAANFDPTHFDAPEKFDIHRNLNRHLGFGYGIHFCLGAPLGRLEARIALAALLERCKHIQLVRTEPLVVKPSSMIYGFQHIPITFKA